jgi:hypothetical protein
LAGFAKFAERLGWPRHLQLEQLTYPFALMTGTFNKAGIRFHYPENWEIVDESLVDSPYTVSLQSPGGGFWSVMIYERGTETTTLLRETLDQMREEYEGLESSVIFDEFESTAATGYEMFFYCLDFLICARAFAFTAASGQIMLLLWQAEDRDFGKYEPVFRAITISLLRELQT